MKLPEFRTAQDQTAASRSTSMASAFMTPQLRPMTERHKAAQHNLDIKARNPDQERELAISKYDASIAVAGAVGDIAKIGIAINEGDQKMAMSAASAEYTREMADFQADEIRNAEEVIDPETDTRRWEEFDTRYAEKSEATLARLRAQYKFSGKENEFNFNQKVLGADQTYTTNLASQANASKINRGAANYERAIADTAGTQAKIDLTNEAYKNLYITEQARDERVQGFRSQDIYTANKADVETTYDNTKLLGKIDEMENQSSLNAQKLTQTQRNEIISDARNQIKANNMFTVDSAYDSGGTSAAAKKIEQLNKAGPAGTGTEDMLRHKSMIGTLLQQLGQYTRLEKATQIEHKEQAGINLLGAQLNERNVTALATMVTNKDKTAINKTYAGTYAAMPDDVFYSDQRDQYVPSVNTKKIGFVLPAESQRVTSDLNNRTNSQKVLAAAAEISRTDKLHQNASRGKNGYKREDVAKAEYFLDAERKGIPLVGEGGEGAVKDWDKIRDNTVEHNKQLYAQSSNNLATDQDMVRRLSEENKYVDDIGFFDKISPDTPEESYAFNQRFSSLYHHYYKVTDGNAGVSERLAFRGATQHFGLTDRYGGDPVWEENSPESLMNDGKPNQWITQQFNDQLVELNKLRAQNRLAPLRRDESRLKHDKEQSWKIMTPLGDHVTDGVNRKNMVFLKANPDLVQEHDLNVDNDNIVQKMTPLSKTVAQQSIKLAPPTFGTIPNATPHEQNDANRNIWVKLSDEQKMEENMKYRAVEEQLDPLGFDGMSIQYFMNSNGYMRGDENDVYIGIPDATDRL